MNSNDFVTWLSGYLEGISLDTSVVDVKLTIQAKLERVQPVIQQYPSPTMPMYQPSPYWWENGPTCAEAYTVMDSKQSELGF